MVLLSSSRLLIKLLFDIQPQDKSGVYHGQHQLIFYYSHGRFSWPQSTHFSRSGTRAASTHVHSKMIMLLHCMCTGGPSIAVINYYSHAGGHTFGQEVIGIRESWARLKLVLKKVTVWWIKHGNWGFPSFIIALNGQPLGSTLGRQLDRVHWRVGTTLMACGLARGHTQIVVL